MGQITLHGAGGEEAGLMHGGSGGGIGGQLGRDSPTFPPNWRAHLLFWSARVAAGFKASRKAINQRAGVMVPLRGRLVPCSLSACPPPPS